MDFLGPCFGNLDPLTEEFVWRVDCHDTENMPTRVARLPAEGRGFTNMQRRMTYTIKVITHAKELMDLRMGNEDEEEEFQTQVHMVTHADVTSTPTLTTLL